MAVDPGRSPRHRTARGAPQSPVLELVGRGAVKIAYDVEEEAEILAKLMTRYEQVPMSLADACLVRMIERYPGSMVLTIDRDFRVYRTHERRIIPAVMPSDL